MNKIFEQSFKTNKEAEEYIFNAINEYTKNTGNSIDTLIVTDYILVLKSYIEAYNSTKNNYSTLIKMACESIDEDDSGVTTVDGYFTQIATTNPNDFLFTKYLMVKNRVDNDLIYDLLLFLKYNLLLFATTNNCRPKYEKEIKMLEDALNKIDSIVDESETEEAGAQDDNMPQELSSKVEKFLEEYKPYKIKEYLDKYIIGQDEAKKIVATTVYNHMIMIAHPEKQLKKNNVLMVGPSGCGKTEIMRVLQRILPVPLSIFDTSGMSQNGWKGDKKVKDAVKELVLKTQDIPSAEHGIIFLDEFDKMCRPAITSSGENVSVHIQGEILAMIEGTSVEVSLAGEDVIGLTELVDTKNILFICAGAFAGIEDIVKKEKNKSASIGINAELKSNDYQMNAKDISKETIIKFGVTPELAGRLTITTVLNKLTKDDMYKILTQCEDNVIDELKTIAETGYGCEIDIKEEAIMSLINRLCMDVGARGLRSIVFEYFNDILFDVSKEKNVKKIIVDKDLQSRLEYKKTRMKKVQGK